MGATPCEGWARSSSYGEPGYSSSTLSHAPGSNMMVFPPSFSPARLVSFVPSSCCCHLFFSVPTQASDLFESCGSLHLASAARGAAYPSSSPAASDSDADSSHGLGPAARATAVGKQQIMVSGGLEIGR